VRPKVEDLSPRTEKPAMTADERLKLQKELIAARDRQESRAGSSLLLKGTSFGAGGIPSELRDRRYE
jgi:hypothetical protein